MAGGKRYVKPPLRWADVGLIALGIAAVVFAVLALRSTSSPAVSAMPSTGSPKATTPTATPTTVKPSASMTPTPTVVQVEKVVFLGDGFTADAAGKSWATLVSEKMGWEGKNLAVDGMGFLVAPEKCPETPCTKFQGMIPKVAAEKPTIVIVAVGTADGDQDITPASATFFKDLHTAVPNARIIALSPMWGSSTMPYWLKLHASSVKAAVGSVQGQYVDIGQPLKGKATMVGANGLPSSEGQEWLAAVVFDALS